jgi:hypothetical protein
LLSHTIERQQLVGDYLAHRVISFPFGGGGWVDVNRPRNSSA